MNQIKIGEYITKLRKQKGLTQDELGEKLGINGKSVSKWERGLHLPDLNNLVALAENLETDVNDLLSGGEYNNDLNKDTTIVENIKAYSNKYRKKYIFMFFIFVIMVILLISFLFFFYNFNKNKIYYISGKNSDYFVDGYLILNPERNILIVRDIGYDNAFADTEKEPKILSINISLLLDDLVLSTYNDDMFDQENFDKITDILSKISIVVDDKNIGDLNVNNNTNLKMIIEYIDTYENYNNQEILFKLDRIYSNNKIIYK